MADEEIKLANGADENEAPAALSGDGPASPASFSSVDGGEETAADLKQEIEALKHDRSDLKLRLDGLLADMERSEVEKKALAAHASYLEGALSAAHHDLATAESAAADSDGEVQVLKNSIEALKAEKSDLEATIANLKANIVALEKHVADLDVQRQLSVVAIADKEQEVLALSNEVEALKMKQSATELEAHEAVEAEAKKWVVREEELEKALKELAEKYSELQGKLAAAENQSKIERDILPINGEKDDEADKTAGNISWVAAGGLAASSATVAAVVTVLFFCYARQR